MSPLPIKPELEIIAGPGAGQTLTIVGSDFQIGRIPDADLFIDDIRISRPHARIRLKSGASYELVDLGSQNHTFLNSKRLVPYQAVRLNDGDRILLVETELVFHQPKLLLQQQEEPGTTVVTSLDDLSSDRLATKSSHPAAALKAVLEVVRALGGGPNISQVLRRVLDGLMEVFPQAERGFIVTSEPDGTFPLAAFRFRHGHSSPPCVSRKICHRVAREGKAVLIQDILMDPEFKGQKSLTSSVRSAICVPLPSHEGKPIGMVQLDRLGGSDNFQKHDLELLAALAWPIGVAVENDRLLEERASWEAAREIQGSLLPRVRPEIAGYQFWECYRPAQEVGGDLYDYIPIEPEGAPDCATRRWAITLGDVAGKGIPAALVMANICPEIRHLVRAGVPPGEILGRVNRHHFDHGADGRFVTLVLTVLDPGSHELTIAVAGHPHALIRRANRRVEEFVCDGAGPPLGSIRDSIYQPTTTRLGPSDVVLLYSDGVTDARNELGSFFTRPRLKRELAGAPQAVAAAGESVLAAVTGHFAGRSQFDDITMACFGRASA
jgi:serine phosphatase RsbU (regulator of sigma subunit)/pSer/pThr/pTyr-binding forkhead associated (FHA) protein